MNPYSFTHLSDAALCADLDAEFGKERSATAGTLARIAEFDVRKLYAPAAYPSTFAYCVGHLRLSEGAALKRIRAARAGRQHPAIFFMVADGRLHLSGVCLLAPRLTPENADELLAAAEKQTRAEIERRLAARFPQADVPTVIRGLGDQVALAAADGAGELSPGTVGTTTAQLSPGTVANGARRERIAPLSPGRYSLQTTLPEGTHGKLRYLQALLGHAVPAGDVPQVLDRAFDALIREVEQRKFAACVRRRPGRVSANPRYVPAAIRRVVYQRDGGQCTFVAASGHRCEARSRLEFDHIEPVARGGQATVAGIRLCCRAHNQYTAECTFGSGFMRRKREQAQARAAERRAAAKVKEAADAVEANARAEASTQAAAEVIPWLRQLGFRADEARRAAMQCGSAPNAPLDARVKLAIASLAPPSARRSAHVAGNPAG
jgi:hypothetical protein